MLSVQDKRDLDDPETQDRLAKMLDMAFWHNESGNLEAAVLACESALVLNPNSTTAHSLLGTLREKQGRDQEAIEQFEAVLAINPDSAADAAKLDNLRRGIRVRAVAPPAHYKWLPPALTSLSLMKMQQRWVEASWHGRPLPKNALAAGMAGAAVLLILGVGFAVVRANQAKVNTGTQIAYVPTPASSSAFGGGASRLTTPIPTTANPIVMTPSAGGAVIPFHFVGRDPFADNEPYTPPSAPSLPHSRGTGTTGGGGGTVAPLPPMNLRAIPPGPTGPAPVSVGDLPQHTVVVSQIGGNVPSSGNSSPTGPDANTPRMMPRIRIVVNHDGITHNDADNTTSYSSPTPTESPSVSPAPVTSDSGASDAGADTAENDQQAALTLQQQGNLKRARTLYAQAIRGYKSQIAAGRNVVAAQRGLQACQTGLQICQQSL